MRSRLWTVLSVFLFMSVGCESGAMQGPNGPGLTPPVPGAPPAPPEPQTPQAMDLMARFAGCMTQQNWTAANMNQWATKRTSGGTKCAHCHELGQGRFLATEQANNVAPNMFIGNRYMTFIGGFFTVQGDQVVAAHQRLANTCGRIGHPPCPYSTQDRAYQALEQFVSMTNANVQNGACPDTGFATPGGAGGIGVQ